MSPRRVTPKSYEPDWVGKLTTQSGPRTTAPMWVRPLLTVGEWSVYTALWSFGNWDGSSAFPTHQKLADRAFVERGTAANAIQKFDRLDLFVRKAPRGEKDPRNEYELREIPTPKLLAQVRAKLAEREEEQIVARAKRRQAKKAPKKAASEEAENPASPAETFSEGGTTGNVPPSAGGGTTQDVPPGTTGDVPPGYTEECPHTYPCFDHDQMTNQPPVSPTGAEAADDAVAEPMTGGDSDQTDEDPKSAPTRTALDDIADELAELGSWNRQTTYDVLEALKALGREPAEIVRVATEVAQGLHGITPSPRRLLSWWPSRPAGQAAKQVVEPSWARGPVAYLDPARERCRMHPSEPAGVCGRCKADARAVDAEEPVTEFELPAEVAQLSPRRAALEMAARAKAPKPRRPEPVGASGGSTT